jgi:uncharacterized membrane protein YeaQ/YmgE (transglycosylase-associated protein family)
MDILILVAAMVVVGLVIGALAGPIWKDQRPLGVRGDYLVAIGTAVVIGLLDWYIIPLMGFSDTLKWLGVIFEPPLGALFVLWLVRKAKS